MENTLENKGKPWKETEDNMLLEEIKNKIDYSIIANNHKRTIGGIKCRIRDLCYNMYKNGSSFEDISKTIGINEIEIKELIDNRIKTDFSREEYKKSIKEKIINTSIPESETQKNKLKKNDINIQINMQNEIISLKEEIKILTQNMKEMMSMIQSIYEFENESKQ